MGQLLAFDTLRGRPEGPARATGGFRLPRGSGLAELMRAAKAHGLQRPASPMSSPDDCSAAGDHTRQDA